MNHEQAEELQLAVKYVLGELPPVQRDEYEDHYIDCPKCAKDVYAAAAFADTAREVLRQEEGSEEPARERERGAWLAWLRPVVAVPVFAALLLALGYQGLVSVPHWKNVAMQASAPRVLPMYSLIAANSRGTETQAIRARAGEPFGLYLDVPADPAYTKYVLRLEEPDGKMTILRTVSFTEAQKTVVVEVTAEKAGAYKIVVLGLTEQLADLARAPVLATMKFVVEVGT